jgi:hypothetical protein
MMTAWWEYLTLAVICVCSLRSAADHQKGAENMNGEEKIRNQKLWYTRIEEMLSSDISQKQWCQNNGININSMYYWLRKYNNDKAMRDQPFSWLELPHGVRTEIADYSDQEMCIKLKCPKATVIMPSDIPPATAAALLKVVAEL